MTGDVLTHMSLREVAKVLNEFSNFEQFQRSFIISKNHIAHINGNTLNMSNGLQITVGDLYRKEFVRFLDEKVLKSRT
jgi:DNA-binding LytR/AlgR family response regulator